MSDKVGWPQKFNFIQLLCILPTRIRCGIDQNEASTLNETGHDLACIKYAVEIYRPCEVGKQGKVKFALAFTFL